MARLPVSDCLPEIVRAAASSRPVVLKAPPGAGKTTGVPPALMSDEIVGVGQILLIQPRRLAARSAAARLAQQLGGGVGETVGYHVRFDKRTSATTCLIAMTTGVLLRRLQRDPVLDGVACVILDEFHERSLEMDLALGMLQRIRLALRPELRIVVMSATLDPAPLVEFFGDAVAVTSEGRSFDVDIRYQNSLLKTSIEEQVAVALPNLMAATAGHVLVFLPGVGEIKLARRKIEAMRLARGCVVCELYGDMDADSQDAVLAISATRKIILATNVAETSITIPGVTGVIDSGLARVMRFDPRVGLPTLQREPISQASAEQRTGRAGRTEPGVCVRLWSATAHRARRERDTPEIERGDFSDALLTLAAWGERDVLAFPWLTPPPTQSIMHAQRLLQRLDAIDDNDNLTETGHQMLAYPLHPRLSRMMVAAQRLGVVGHAAMAAALLTERDPFRNQTDANSSGGDCDVFHRVERLCAVLDGRDRGSVNLAAAKQIKRVADQIQRMAGSHSVQRGDESQSDSQRLKRALLAAYPDRVALRRSFSSEVGVMVGGRGVRLDRRSLSRDGELFLCIDSDASGSEAIVYCASSLNADWLDQRFIHEVDEPFFNPTLKAVVVRRRTYFDDLMLAESPATCRPGPAVAELLFHHARQAIERCFPAEADSITSFIARVRFLCQRMPDAGIPPLDDGATGDVLRSLCATRTSIAELKTAPWLDSLRSRFDYSQLQSIDQHAPAKIVVPSGNAIAIQYSDGKSPIMEVRIQELFGMRQTPRVAGGRVPIQLHLLGPNRQPQQITEDLENFWAVTYAQIRKELRRRYPKHFWPDDPTTATATRNGLKPK